MYYVYSYLREDFSPYYIGKGCKDRAYAYSNHRINAPKDRSKVYIIKTNLTEAEAYKVEKLYILMFGRKDLGTGILRNLSDGGEGPTGYKTTPEQRRKISLSRMGEKHPLYGVSPSEETREKQRQALKGKYVKEKNPMYGKTHTEEARKIISERHKGIPKSEEHKKKISESNKGKTISQETKEKLRKNVSYYRFTFKNKNTIVVKGINEFCRMYPQYHKYGICNVKNGKQKYHKDIIKVEKL